MNDGRTLNEALLDIMHDQEDRGLEANADQIRHAILVVDAYESMARRVHKLETCESLTSGIGDRRDASKGDERG